MTPHLDHPNATLRRYRGEYAAHEHRHAQVLFGVAGRLELELGGRAYEVGPGSGLVVPPGVSHGYLARGDARAWVIDAPAAIGLDRTRSFALPAALRVQIPLAIDAAAWLEAIPGTPRRLPRRRLDAESLSRAVDAALHEDWSRSRMAAWCHLSVPRFHARWLEATGLSPQAWLRLRRLDVAARLLAAGLTLDAAALQVGYRSASALAFALRRERGVGALTLRRRSV